MKIFATVALAIMITGCASPVTKDWGASGGSKADGTVQLSVRYGDMQTPILDDAQGKRAALARCEKWGYSSVDEFDFVNKVCMQPGGLSGCRDTVITKTYQCQD